MLPLFTTLAVGAAAGFILLKLKVPGGMMVGAIIGVSCLTILTGFSAMPYAAKQAAQMAAGAFIGCSVEREDLSRLRYIYKPAAAMLFALLALNLIMGFVIYAITPLDLLTAFLCAIPGGISEMPLIAMDFGADAAKVAVMQFARMVVGVGFFPGFIAWVNKREVPEAAEAAATSCAPCAASNPEACTPPALSCWVARWKPILTAVVCAAVCGIAGLYSPIPSGALLLPILGVLGLKLRRVPIHLPRKLRRFAQVLAGSYIGCSVTYQDLLDLKQLTVPAVILLAGYLLNSYLSGRMLRRYFGLTLKQGMLATSPAGASDIALISADIGVQSADVVILQVLRMLAAISVFPYILQFVASAVGG